MTVPENTAAAPRRQSKPSTGLKNLNHDTRTKLGGYMKGLILFCVASLFSVNSFAFLTCTTSTVDELQLMTPSELHKKFCYDAGQFNINMSQYETLRNPKDGIDANQCLAVMNTVNLVYRKQTGQTLESKTNCQDFSPKIQ